MDKSFKSLIMSIHIIHDMHLSSSLAVAAPKIIRGIPARWQTAPPSLWRRCGGFSGARDRLVCWVPKTWVPWFRNSVFHLPSKSHYPIFGDWDFANGESMDILWEPLFSHLYIIYIYHIYIYIYLRLFK